MIAVIDYDAGNIHSVMNALAALNRQAFLTADPDEVKRAEFVLLPGVGSFGQAADSLKESGMDEALKTRFKADRPTLGICLGLQLMFEFSEESPNAEGLGLFKGGVKKLDCEGLKVPHIGWSTLERTSGCFKPFENEFFYFVHSFAVCPEDGEVSAAYACYGKPFTAAVQRGAFAACQFHPEKSGAVGLRLLDNLTKGAK